MGSQILRRSARTPVQNHRRDSSAGRPATVFFGRGGSFGRGFNPGGNVPTIPGGGRQRWAQCWWLSQSL